MTRNHLIGLAAGLALPGVLLASAVLSPVRHEQAQPDTARLASVVDAWRDRADVPGLVVSVRDASGEQWVRASGDLHAVPGLAAESRFRIGSITKVFVAVVVLQLAEEGRLSLDDEVSRHLPGTQAPGAVTLRQLLDHTSGVPDYSAADPRLGATVLRDRSRRWTPAELVAMAAQARPEFAAGTDYAYSNTNYLLLGMVIESVTGTPWWVQVRQRLLEPLHLGDTYVAGAEPRPGGDGVVPGFFDADRDGEEENVETDGAEWTSLATSEDAAGAIVSTASDVTAFGHALAHGALLGADTLTAMLSAPPLHPDGSAYGLGLETKVLGGELTVWGHGGFVPGFRSTMWHEPDRDLTVAVLADSSSANTEDLAELLIRASPRL
jgi:D-alanyl-D-alanine carboxypeptidase